jgi:MFS family permease
LGARNLLPLGSLTIAAAGVFFALAHDTVWQTLTMMAITGVGLGLTAAVMPGLIVRSVPDGETGSALGFYQVVRFIGMALGSAIAGLIIAGHTATGALWPQESAYIVVLLAGAGICVLAATFAWAVPGSPVDQNVVEDDFAVENAELGPVGLVGLPDKTP